MRIVKTFMATAMLALYSMSAVAQTSNYNQTNFDAEAQELGYNPYPYGFVQVQGGVGTTFTDVNCLKLISPTFSVAVGEMFNPVLGARLHVNGKQSVGGFDAIGQYYEGLTALEPTDGVWKLTGDPIKYKYNYINTNLDLMFNLVNIFSKKVHHPLDLYLIGGFGLNYAWNNEEFEDVTSRYNIDVTRHKAWGDQTNRSSLLSYNFRVGLLVDYNIAKHLSVGAEIDMNALSDRFNSKRTHSSDWMMTAQLSLTYKFGFKKARKPAPETVIATPVYQDTKQAETAPAPTPTPVVVEEPVQEVKVEPVDENIFYAIRASNLEDENTIDKIAEWCKKNPNKTITVSGYADKGTGNAKINAKYAKLRADKVAAALQRKGVPASQMTVKSYGDTVQPFAENDMNRCVIIKSE